MYNCSVIVTVKGKTDTNGYPFEGVNHSLSVRHPFKRLKKSIQSVQQTIRMVVTSVLTVSTSVQMVFASVHQLGVSIRRTAASVRTV